MPWQDWLAGWLAGWLTPDLTEWCFLLQEELDMILGALGEDMQLRLALQR
jgi:hypothetical protein